MTTKRKISMILAIVTLIALLPVFGVTAMATTAPPPSLTPLPSTAPPTAPVISGLAAERDSANGVLVVGSFNLANAPEEGLTASLVAVLTYDGIGEVPVADDLSDAIYVQQYTWENGACSFAFPVDYKALTGKTLRIFISAEGVSEYLDFQPPRLNLGVGQAPSFIIRKNMMMKLNLDTNLDVVCVSSNPAIVLATPEGILTGKLTGVAVIQVKDIKYGYILNIVVTCSN